MIDFFSTDDLKTIFNNLKSGRKIEKDELLEKYEREARELNLKREQEFKEEPKSQALESQPEIAKASNGEPNETKNDQREEEIYSVKNFTV